MLAHQWVENIQAMEGEIEKDGVEVSPGVGMITLPGGAVLWLRQEKESLARTG